MKRYMTSGAIVLMSIIAVSCNATPSGPKAPSLREACGADIKKACAGVDHSAMRECVKSHMDEFSAPCKAAIAARKAAAAAGGGGGGGGAGGGGGGD